MATRVCAKSRFLLNKDGSSPLHLSSAGPRGKGHASTSPASPSPNARRLLHLWQAFLSLSLSADAPGRLFRAVAAEVHGPFPPQQDHQGILIE